MYLLWAAVMAFRARIVSYLARIHNPDREVMAHVRTASVLDGNYVIVSNKLAQDKTLSAKSRGIALYVLSFPRDWRFTAELLNKDLPEGLRAIKSALKELEERGYLRRKKYRNDKGAWIWEWILMDAPNVFPG